MGDGAHVQPGDNSVWLVLFTSLCVVWKLNSGHQTYSASIFTHWASSLLPGFYQMDKNICLIYLPSLSYLEQIPSETVRPCLASKMGQACRHLMNTVDRRHRTPLSFFLCFLPHWFLTTVKSKWPDSFPSLYYLSPLPLFGVHILPLLHQPITFNRL